MKVEINLFYNFFVDIRRENLFLKNKLIEIQAKKSPNRSVEKTSPRSILASNNTTILRNSTNSPLSIGHNIKVNNMRQEL